MVTQPTFLLWKKFKCHPIQFLEFLVNTVAMEYSMKRKLKSRDNFAGELVYNFAVNVHTVYATELISHEGKGE